MAFSTSSYSFIENEVTQLANKSASLLAPFTEPAKSNPKNSWKRPHVYLERPTDSGSVPFQMRPHSRPRTVGPVPLKALTDSTPVSVSPTSRNFWARGDLGGVLTIKKKKRQNSWFVGAEGGESPRRKNPSTQPHRQIQGFKVGQALLGKGDY